VGKKEQQAGEAVPNAAADKDKKPAAELSDELWQELLKAPAAVKGSQEAEITIVEFTDYQCPFCKRYADQTLGQLEKNYVATGKVKYVIHDLPLPFHSNAQPAAEAARCAAEQDKYWPYHDKLFEKQTEWSEGESQTWLKQYAAQLGLDQGQFNSCLDEGKYKQAVEDDAALAQKAGASGTPTFFINGKKLVGAQPYAAFKTIIEAELK
jgi:protein-disulfide isomerase